MIVIIFSKNRAMQLDALLQSMEKYFLPTTNVKLVVVLYKATTQAHRDSYTILAGTYSSTSYFFVEEVDFKKQLEWLMLTGYEICFLVDDDIFYKRVPTFKHLLPHETRSLRLGDNVTNKNHFNYTISVDGNIFRQEDILPYFREIDYENPNELEGRLVPYQQWFTMLTTEQYVVGVPHNRVSDSSGCKFSGKFPEDTLVKDFMEGKRIDIDAMDYSDIRGVHSHIEYKFK